MRHRGLDSLVLLLVASLAAAAPSRADLLYFRRGGVVQLPCRRVGSRVIVQAPTGDVEFAADDVSRIVPGGDPAGEWPDRLATARKDGSDAILAAAWWALENGLTPEAAEVLRGLHAADPEHEPTRALIDTLDAISPPLPAPDLAALTSSLGGTFRTKESPHFVLLTQAADADALARLDVLERVYVSFYLTFAGQGLPLRPPREKLVAAVFERRADYVGFLSREGADAFASTLGYYHPTRKAVVSFDARDLPALRNRPDAAAAGRDAARLSLLLDLERRAFDLGMAAHEATHQLAALSGLSPRHDDFPIWLHEGLAAQFEVVRGGRVGGRGTGQRPPPSRLACPAAPPCPLPDRPRHGLRTRLPPGPLRRGLVARLLPPQGSSPRVHPIPRPPPRPTADARGPSDPSSSSEPRSAPMCPP